MKEKKTYEELLAENLVLQNNIQRQKDRIAYLERLLFGGKRDKLKTIPPSPGLFDDFFDEAFDAKQNSIEKTTQEISKEASERRKQSKTSPNRPSKYQYSGLEEEWSCEYPSNINLDDYDEIGEDIVRILHRSPARVWVSCIKRPILRLKSDKNADSPKILQAPAPRAILGGNHVAADLLSQLIADKFVYHIPEYRQVKMYSNLGVKLPTSTINDWIHAVANKLYPLYESLCSNILQSDYLQIDEVPWKIADRPGESCRNGYAWQFRDANPNSRGSFFYYYKGSRAGDIPRSQLKNFKGAIQTDGYKVYDYFESQTNVTTLGCMAHVQRKFIEAQKSHPRQAAEAINYIQYLYTLEENLRARKASFQEIKLEREEKALAIMDTMEAWMRKVSIQCVPDDPLGKALDYAYKLWPRLRRYALDGKYSIDNNAVERGQRPTVIGRKNYLFSKTNRGAEDNAIFYSLLESCNIAGINQIEWLMNVLNALNEDSSEEEIIKLLPVNYKK